MSALPIKTSEKKNPTCFKNIFILRDYTTVTQCLLNKMKQKKLKFIVQLHCDKHNIISMLICKYQLLQMKKWNSLIENNIPKIKQVTEPVFNQN